MQISVNVTLSPEFGVKLTRLANIAAELLPVGGRAVFDFLRDYHSKMDWKGPNWFPGPYSGEFAQNVVKGWQEPVVSGDSVTIRNTFGLLGWKITGGTITPKTAGALAIPLIPAARGLYASEYHAARGQELFREGAALFQIIGRKVEAVYALAKSVTQAPWPGAMPADEDIRQTFIVACDQYLEERIQ